ncbi:peroxisomal assembly protein [Coemansia sp. RSA 2618]|nr:peroxisomal assembly protein [Coemansia sp. RSA 2618]
MAYASAHFAGNQATTRTDAASRARNDDSAIDPEYVDVDPASDLALDHITARGSAHRFAASEIVFFKVVLAEGFRDRRGTNGLQAVPSLEDDSGSDCSDSEDEQSDIEEADSYDLCEIDSGLDAVDMEWALWHRQTKNAGFIIEPDITNVTQAGAEHSFVPYRTVAAYIDAGESGSNTARSCSSAVPYADALDQLLRLAKASSHPLALSRNLICAALLKGNPGTGKRTLVREVAEQLGVHLYELSCYDILSDTEDKTAQVLQMYFQNARRYTPCILHLRSIDALAQASNAPPGQDTPDDLPIARVLKSCISSLGQAHHESGFPIIVVATSSQPDKLPTALATAFRHEIDMPVPDEGQSVFAIGATNRPDLLDPALLRPGRFDKLVYLGVSETHDAQLNIIQALTRKFHLHPDLDLRDIAEKCPFHYTGADFYALCSDSLLKAMLRTVDEVDVLVNEWNAGKHQQVPGSVNSNDESQTHYPVPMTPQYYLDHIADESIKQVTVTTSDFERALDELIPSVSADELVRYQVLRRQFDSAQKKQDQDPLRKNDESSVPDLLPSDILENIQQSLHAQQKTSAEDITVGENMDSAASTNVSISEPARGAGLSGTKRRSRKGKEPEV